MNFPVTVRNSFQALFLFFPIRATISLKTLTGSGENINIITEEALNYPHDEIKLRDGLPHKHRKSTR